ncbi:MAG TPA: hypothetical protein ACFYD5_02470 [Candidatus Tripitaka sp. YC43]
MKDTQVYEFWFGQPASKNPVIRISFFKAEALETIVIEEFQIMVGINEDRSSPQGETFYA